MNKYALWDRQCNIQNDNYLHMSYLQEPATESLKRPIQIEGGAKKMPHEALQTSYCSSLLTFFC